MWLGHHFQSQKVTGQLAGGGDILWRPRAQLVLLVSSFSVFWRPAENQNSGRTPHKEKVPQPRAINGHGRCLLWIIHKDLGLSIVIILRRRLQRPRVVLQPGNPRLRASSGCHRLLFPPVFFLQLVTFQRQLLMRLDVTKSRYLWRHLGSCSSEEDIIINHRVGDDNLLLHSGQ